MRAIIIAASAAFALLTVPASAAGFSSNITVYCGDRVCGYVSARHVHRVRVARHHAARHPVHHALKRSHMAQHASGLLSAVIGPLAAKAAEIVSACGSRVVSAHRPGARIAGSGHYSLHARYPSRAVDLAGNPACIYGRLKGWPGGYSTDYRRVAHIHVSYDPHGKEWGARFVHGGGYRSTQYARRGDFTGSHW